VRIGEECADQPWTLLQPPQGADGLGLEILLAGDTGLADPVVLDVLPDPFSRFAIVHAALDRRLLARRLSAGRACSGWLSGLSGCEHAIRRVGARRGRRGRGYLLQMTAVTTVSEGELWRSFPEVTRSDILVLLGMLLERWAVSAGLAAEGAGGEHGTGG
jgi:hypothetical protein